MAPLQAISLLVTKLLHVVQGGRLVEERAPLEEKMSPAYWQLPVGHGRGSHWAPDTQPFPPLGGRSQTDHGQNGGECLDRTDGVLGSGSQLVPISSVEMDGGSWSVVPPRSKAQRMGGGMRPARGSRPCPPGGKAGYASIINSVLLKRSTSLSLSG